MARLAQPVGEGEKWCPKCKQPRKVGIEFSIKQSWCKQCLSERQRSTYNYEKMRDRQIRQNYPGFDVSQYNAMFEAQGGVCAVCGQSEETRLGRSNRSEIAALLAIDHCHKTNKVRALLCHSCNQAFGLLEENPKRIEALLRYAYQQSESEDIP